MKQDLGFESTWESRYGEEKNANKRKAKSS